MDEILRFLHSLVRWGVLLVTIALFAYLLIGWLRNRPWESLGDRLLAIFSALIGAQWLLGVLLLAVLLLAGGGISPQSWGHVVIMTLALAVAHSYRAFQRREMADKARYQRYLILVIITLALVFVGIFSLPSPIQWRFYMPA
jgi:uncharacterized membrane protein YphA (DoxX/SURF4 family)